MADDAEGMARAAVDLAATSRLSVDDALRVIAEAARLLAAADIVRGFAATEPFSEDSGGGLECIYCAAYFRLEPADHDETCPWRRAVEWVSTQEDQT